MGRKCIFCGEMGRMTKEHFWPRWFGKLLIKKGIATYISECFVGEGKQSASKLTNQNERQGDLTTMKFRVVCKSCNGGWMSQQEQSVKPVLLALVNGHKDISATDARKIATWAAMKVMVAEFAEQNTVLTPNSDRKKFKDDLKIPDYYSVFIGFHDTDAHAGYLRHSSTVSKSINGPSPSIPPECFRNCQVVSFLIGSVVLHVVCKRIDGLSPAELRPEKYVAEIWPSVNQIHKVDALPIMNNHSLSELAHWMERVLNDPKVKYGGKFRRSFDVN